jgi:hypothetical protein
MNTSRNIMQDQIKTATVQILRYISITLGLSYLRTMHIYIYIHIYPYDNLTNVRLICSMQMMYSLNMPTVYYTHFC